jgi:hypothetical protein
MDPFISLSTGSGYWNPILWLIAVGVAAIITYLIWITGEKSYKKGTKQEKPFISGNLEPDRGHLHVRAGHLYWGFTEALKGYYRRLVPLHTGILNDYVLWFLGIMAFTMIVVWVVR